MDNYHFSVDDYIKSIEDNNQNEIELNTYAMHCHIQTIFKQLLVDYANSNFIKTTHSFSKNRVLYEIYKTNMHIIKQELKIASYLIGNINYLHNFDDTKSAIALVNIYYYFVLTDFDRIDFIELNSNKGRTIISGYLLDEINEYFDRLVEYLDVYSKSDNIRIRDVKNEK